MIQFGSEAQFARVRQLFETAGFYEEQLCQRLGIPSLENFEEDFERTDLEDYGRDATGALIELFVEGHYIDGKLAEQQFGADALAAMNELGLLDAHGEQIAATVALYPTAGLWIASDRWNTPDRTTWKTPPDVVYPAIVSNAQRFLKFLPETACDCLLDLCSGTAFAALNGAKQYAGEAWALDISERATIFGEFNRRLNDIANVTIATSDLYESAGDQQFDRIVAHPPYVPVLRPKWVYQDGGSDGEQIVRGCIQGIPDHLRPGGLFYLLAMGSDREDNTWERRIRSYLGEDENEFDIGVFVVRTLDPDEFAVRAVVNSENPPQDLREFKRLFSRLGMRQMVYAVLLIQRRSEIRPVFTIRRQNSATTTIAEIMSSMKWETDRLTPNVNERVLQSWVRANPGAELRVKHTLSAEEGWQPAEYMLRTSHPFSMEARTDPWAPFLLAACDGAHRAIEHYEGLRVQEVIPDTTAPEEFAEAIGVLVSGGLLELSAVPFAGPSPDDSAQHPSS